MVSLGEENFNNQMGKMTHSVDISQPFLPVTPVFIQWTHEQSGHVGMDWGMAGLNNMDFYSPVLTWI